MCIERVPLLICLVDSLMGVQTIVGVTTNVFTFTFVQPHVTKHFCFADSKMALTPEV